MEEYEGVVILATNLRQNMDEAFVRRLHFAVEFPFPAEEDRRRIWERVWPDDAPSGRRCRRRGARPPLRARRREHPQHRARRRVPRRGRRSTSIRMSHLVHATRREYQKMGKIVAEGEFGA